MNRQEYTNIARKLNLSDEYCPRCNKRTVNKANRRCDECKGRLFWAGDEAGIKDAIDKKDGFYVWHRSVYNLEGWFELSYFGVSYAVKK